MMACKNATHCSSPGIEVDTAYRGIRSAGISSLLLDEHLLVLSHCLAHLARLLMMALAILLLYPPFNSTVIEGVVRNGELAFARLAENDLCGFDQGVTTIF